MKKYSLFVCLLFCSLFLFGQRNSDDFISANHFFDSVNREIKQDIMDSVFKAMVKNKHFNGVLLVGQQDKILYQNYNGYANYKSKQKLHLNSQIEIASVSKQFTAVAVLQLYEQNKIQLTDTVGKYLENFPYQGISIDMLLCHRSGLPDYLNFSAKFHDDRDFQMDNDSLLKMMIAHHPAPRFRPDSIFEYSNTGYAILAMIVEKVSGESFAQYLQKNIFDPCQMENTFLLPYGKPKEGACTIGHRASYTVYQRDFMSGVVGDKSILTTVHDLFLWNLALYGETILSQKTLALAYTPKHKEQPASSNYGYGWRLSLDKWDAPIVYHGGLWNGNNTLFIRRLKDQSCVIILSNVCNRGFSGKGDQLLNIVYAL